MNETFIDFLFVFTLVVCIGVAIRDIRTYWRVSMAGKDMTRAKWNVRISGALVGFAVILSLRHFGIIG